MRTAALMIVSGVLLASGAHAAGETGKTFRDCTDCPEMVTLPAGTYTMGSPPSERYRGDETQHRVRIGKPFAIGKYEVTFAQWDACIADGGCNGYRPDDQGWGRGDRPAINVSWRDAKAYVAWLSKKTGKPYRLPSETEWEYAARAGTTTAYAFGDTLGPDQANFDASGTGGTFRQKTLPVGSFAPNAFGLYDMHGNVWEWVEDCWNDSYGPNTSNTEAPAPKGDCGGHVIRGGGWEDYAGDLRSAARTGGAADDQYYTDGFRVALSL